MENPDILDYLTPHSDEAEKAVLGSCIQDNDVISPVLKRLVPECFYNPRNRVIFTVISFMEDHRITVDQLSIIQELKERGELEKCGGPAYVTSLPQLVPSTANIDYYIDIVYNHFVRRHIIEASNKMIQDARKENNDVRSILESADADLKDLVQRNIVGNYFNSIVFYKKVIDDMAYHLENETSFGLMTGFEKLDEYTDGFKPSEFIIIGARPSIGKTALALAIAANMALGPINSKKSSIDEVVPVGFFSLEMNGTSILNRLIPSRASVDAKKLKKLELLTAPDFARINEVGDKLKYSNFFICDTPNMRLLDLRATARRLVHEQDVKIIFVDYISLIEVDNKATPRHEQVAEISRSLKSLARELDIPIVALSQLNRDAEQKDGKSVKPSLGQIRESGAIEQDADIVMFLHRDRNMRDEYGNEIEKQSTQLIVAKNRNGQTGELDIIFNSKYVIYEDE